MRPLAIAFVVLIVAAYTNMAIIESLDDDDNLVNRIDRSSIIEKRETDKDSLESFATFLEEKLTQQSQALEHLVKVVDQSGDMVKKLVENLSKGIQKPKLPAKATAEEVPLTNNSSVGPPMSRLGKNMTKYGKLAKDLFMKDINTGTDPTPLIENEPDSPTFLELPVGSRRSFGSNPVLIPSEKPDDKPNPWCPMALLCEKTVDPICGFDEEFGYGKFEDICHMLRVNCYWKYNFAMVLSCRPTL